MFGLYVYVYSLVNGLVLCTYNKICLVVSLSYLIVFLAPEVRYVSA